MTGISVSHLAGLEGSTEDLSVNTSYYGTTHVAPLLCPSAPPSLEEGSLGGDRLGGPAGLPAACDDS